VNENKTEGQPKKERNGWGHKSAGCDDQSRYEDDFLKYALTNRIFEDHALGISIRAESPERMRRRNATKKD
jgi:hypothetical protein